MIKFKQAYVILLWWPYAHKMYHSDQSEYMQECILALVYLNQEFFIHLDKSNPDQTLSVSLIL